MWTFSAELQHWLWGILLWVWNLGKFGLEPGATLAWALGALGRGLAAPGCTHGSGPWGLGLGLGPCRAWAWAWAWAWAMGPGACGLGACGLGPWALGFGALGGPGWGDFGVRPGPWPWALGRGPENPGPGWVWVLVGLDFG